MSEEKVTDTQSVGSVPQQLRDGWQTISLSQAGMDTGIMASLTEKITAQEYPNTHSVLIVRNGALVYEQYFSGEDKNWRTSLGEITFHHETLHDIRSVSKSITAALIGIAKDEEKISDLDQGLLDFFPEYAHLLNQDKQGITLRHLLTMTAGFEWDEESYPYSDPRNSEVQMHQSSDPLEYVLGLKLTITPGSKFTYNGGHAILLAGVIAKATGKPLDEYARDVLFGPLGITRFEWRRHVSGIPNAASGLRLRPRDMAKFGYLYLNQGRWKGIQVISSGWIEETMTRQVERAVSHGYGFQWWFYQLAAAQEKLELWTAAGNGGQRIFIIPKLRMMVVTTAGNYNPLNLETRRLPDRLLREYILPATGIVDVELPP